MEVDRACLRCKRSLPAQHFVGVRGGIIKACAACRGKPIPEPATQPPPLAPELASSSPLSTPPSVPGTPSRPGVPPPPAFTSSSFASASSVLALEQRLGNFERSFGQQLADLLSAVQASQPQPLPTTTSPAPATSTLLQPPGATTTTTPAGTSAFHSAGATHSAGELPNLLSASRCFAWVPLDVVRLVEGDQLKPEHLVRLRNPESRVSKEPARSAGLILDNGTITIADKSTESHTSAFVKVIPNLAALSSIWVVYVAIRGRYTGNWDLVQALLAHLSQLIEFDAVYQWKAVADYHLAVCRKLFGTQAVREWSVYDPQLVGQLLLPSFKPAGSTPPSSSSRSDNKQSGSSKASGNSRNTRSSANAAGEACHRFNAGTPCSGCARQHVCMHCKGPHPMQQCVGLNKTGSTIKKASS